MDPLAFQDNPAEFSKHLAAGNFGRPSEEILAKITDPESHYIYLSQFPIERIKKYDGLCLENFYKYMYIMKHYEYTNQQEKYEEIKERLFADPVIYLTQTYDEKQQTIPLNLYIRINMAIVNKDINEINQIIDEYRELCFIIFGGDWTFYPTEVQELINKQTSHIMWYHEVYKMIENNDFARLYDNIQANKPKFTIKSMSLLTKKILPSIINEEDLLYRNECYDYFNNLIAKDFIHYPKQFDISILSLSRDNNPQYFISKIFEHLTLVGPNEPSEEVLYMIYNQECKYSYLALFSMEFIRNYITNNIIYNRNIQDLSKLINIIRNFYTHKEFVTLFNKFSVEFQQQITDFVAATEPANCASYKYIDYLYPGADKLFIDSIKLLLSIYDENISVAMGIVQTYGSHTHTLIKNYKNDPAIDKFNKILFEQYLDNGLYDQASYIITLYNDCDMFDQLCGQMLLDDKVIELHDMIKNYKSIDMIKNSSLYDRLYTTFNDLYQEILIKKSANVYEKNYKKICSIAAMVAEYFDEKGADFKEIIYKYENTELFEVLRCLANEDIDGLIQAYQGVEFSNEMYEKVKENLFEAIEYEKEDALEWVEFSDNIPDDHIYARIIDHTNIEYKNYLIIKCAYYNIQISDDPTYLLFYPYESITSLNYVFGHFHEIIDDYFNKLSAEQKQIMYDKIVPEKYFKREDVMQHLLAMNCSFQEDMVRYLLAMKSSQTYNFHFMNAIINHYLSTHQEYLMLIIAKFLLDNNMEMAAECYKYSSTDKIIKNKEIFEFAGKSGNFTIDMQKYAVENNLHTNAEFMGRLNQLINPTSRSIVRANNIIGHIVRPDVLDVDLVEEYEMYEFREMRELVEPTGQTIADLPTGTISLPTRRIRHTHSTQPARNNGRVRITIAGQTELIQTTIPYTEPITPAPVIEEIAPAPQIQRRRPMAFN